MSTGHVVVDGAICKCQFGDVPDVLVVQSQQKGYINDNAAKKLIANTMDLGSPFKAKTFGQCKLQPMGSSFKPCMPMITQWQEFYDKVILSNQGQILTEKSKATCAIAGAPCVEFTWHGQTAEGGGVGNTEEEADEEIQSQLNPLVNPNEEPFLAQELNGGSFDDTGKPIEKRKINVQIETIKTTFVPLGIADFDGNEENEYLKFKIKISENSADKMKIKVFQDGEPYYNNDIKESSMLSLGEHEWEWDGFGDYGDYDSKSFKDKDIAVEVTVWLDGQEKSHRISLEKKKSIGKEWVDVSIQRNIKEMIVTLRVNLRDGGEKGLNSASKIPLQAISNYGEQPITSREVSFEKLKNEVVKGINKHWSRDKTNSNQVSLKGELWNIKTIAEISKNGMVAPEIIFITNSKVKRSRNFILSRKLYYQIGYNYNKPWTNFPVNHPVFINKGWSFDSKSTIALDFQFTSAHEIGHELLTEYGGGFGHSYNHKNTSTTLSQETLSSQGNFPTNGEIDLMKYYKNYPKSKLDVDRVVASEDDLKGLIWLSKIIIE
ncbi:hypothetical protein Celal_3716 [Cellulophaga algicola DSM 14237]|uniref:DUF4280 domain-containing protein n=1 Tax=Cellulophaga algicola (strain DSM 14237 / IC166 / ACAM 630) TaxID=688270 RepID=E6XA10_CELAD|nr:PAAR-like protein [Cellulophaga algicola]ADV50971.1 hypothetical protein Celal_3716 [Cellulophaga algicola DSM 14237]